MKRITTMIDIAATPEQVWDVLIDFPAHAEWNPFFASIEGQAVEGTTLKVTARQGDGTGMSFTPTVLAADPGRLLRWRGKVAVPGLFEGTHEFILSPLPSGGTRLVHREGFRGLLVPFMGRVLRETEDGFRAFNEALRARVAQQLAAVAA